LASLGGLSNGLLRGPREDERLFEGGGLLRHPRKRRSGRDTSSPKGGDGRVGITAPYRERIPVDIRFQEIVDPFSPTSILMLHENKLPVATLIPKIIITTNGARPFVEKLARYVQIMVEAAFGHGGSKGVPGG